MTDQVDWDSALRKNAGRVNALGLYDLDRHILPVGKAFRKIVAEWSDALRTQSVCLRVPVYRPSQSEWATGLDTGMPRRRSLPLRPSARADDDDDSMRGVTEA
ncbi:MAG TPA: hypothetical protein VFP68_21135 [Burkholderiaceae bacterium]|nr:hypothetical protein [Burkholderiaceae bacterium]